MQKRNANSNTNPKNKSSYTERKGRTANIKSDLNVADRKDRFKLADKADCWVKGNDPRWYNQFPDQVKNYANFNFYAPVGSKVWLTDETAHLAVNDDRFPGIMALYFAPAAGTSEGGNSSPLNLAANRLYQFTRFENNGSSEYDRGDLMLYFLAMDSCYMYHAWLKRIYGTITRFSNMNRYIPKAFMRAERVDYDDLEANLADFRAYINQYAHKLEQLPIPNSMSYMARHAWMANNIFVDEDTERCQFYLWVPQYFYKFGIWDIEPYVGEPYLDYVKPSYKNNALTFEQLKAVGTELLAPIVANEDFNLIGADVIKAFGTNGVVKLETIPDDYKVSPLYSEEVLDQIENAVAIGHPATDPLGTGTGWVRNRGKAVYWDAATNTLVPNDSVWVPFDLTQTYQLVPKAYRMGKVVNFEKDGVTNDDVMVATRLTYNGYDHFQADNGYWLGVAGLGSELLCQFSMFFFTEEGEAGFRLGNTTMGYYAHPIIHAMPHGDASTTAEEWRANLAAATLKEERNKIDNARFIQTLSMFRRHPQVMVYGLTEFVRDDGKGNPEVTGADYSNWEKSFKRFGDTANFAVFELDDLTNLSEVALQSEFFVPLTASGPVKVG